MSDYKHKSVLLDEVLEYLNPKKGQVFVDCTLGGAGYSLSILEKVQDDALVIGIDRDKLAIDNAKKFAKENLLLVNDNFSNLENIIKDKIGNKKVNGIVMDLGLSSAQLDDVFRGFSFLKDAPLSMEMGGNEEDDKVINILNKQSERSIFEIIKNYGEEQFAFCIARGIVEFRKNEEIKTTQQLVKIIESAVPFFYKNNRKIHFATKTFQALRIASNRELENLSKILPQAIDLLEKGGRLIIVSFHSLEDRIVKNYFRKEARDCLCPVEIPICCCEHRAQIKIINKKIIIPKQKEVKENKRSRSAKMRVAEKI